MEGDRGESRGNGGGGSVREAREEGAGDGILKGAGVGRNRKCILQHFAIETRAQRREQLWEGAGTGLFTS